MKLSLKVTRTVHQSMDIDVEVPDADLVGMTPKEIEETFMGNATESAGNEDFSGLEKEANYEADIPSIGMGLNWVKRPGTDIMVVGSMAAPGNIGTVDYTPVPNL
jgi:hypothetical protein